MFFLKEINKEFSKKIVLDKFSYEFEKNKIYKLEGPNGIGKTTLLKIIKGIIIQDSGDIIFDNQNHCKSTICYIDSNSRSFIHRLNVYENLLYFLSLEKIKKTKTQISILFNEFDATELLFKDFSSLSLGQMQLISFLKAVLINPDVLLLDEIFTSIDEKNISKITSFIKNHVNKDNNLAIICNHSIKLSIDFDEVISL